MASGLEILHIVAPFILLLPLLHLTSAPKTPSAELPGIRAIKIRIITPRRGLILTLICLLAFTSVLDASIFAADVLISPHQDVPRSQLDIVSAIIYALGGFVIWGLTAIVVEWRTKWGDGSLALLAFLAFGLEVANLPMLAVREVHSGQSHRIFDILAIPPSALRVLLLLALLTAVINPRVTYEDATETTGLLNGHGEQSSDTSGREAYGTFNGTRPSSRATTQLPGQTAPSGAATPTPAGPAKPGSKISIPKKLGEKKEEDKPLQWSEFWPKLKKLSPHLWPSTSPRLQIHCVVVVIILLVGRFLNPLVPISLGMVIRALTDARGNTGSSIWPSFITYFTIRSVISGGLLDFIRQFLWVSVYQYTDREMMMLCFNHLLNLSLAYHTKRNTGEVMRIIDRGSAINNLFQTLLFTAIPTVIDIVIAFGILYWLYGSTISIVTIITMVTYISVSYSMTRSRVKFRRELMERDVKQRGIVNDVLTNWESVKYFTAEQRELDRFRTAVVQYQETEAKWTINYSLLNLVQTFLLTLGLMLGALIICLRVLADTADAAEFVVFIQYFQQLSRPLDNLGSLYRSLNTNTTDAEKMFNLLAQATEVTDKPGAKDLVVTDGIIEFDNVNFSYDGKVQALKNVSFKIGKGQSMALVGESGSGKSTILRLLYRFYDINSGHIYIDGQDISNVTQTSLRKAIGIVPQDSVLWNDTIGANISYGKEDATDEEIIAAAQAAKLHDRILTFPEEYGTTVGERGVRLSGGEKQRVSLARMFLKSPAILVLDEATSALDTETEREIQRALAELAKGRSSLSIAHRLSTIINSDQIVVMKDGQVIEHGGYKELLEQQGTFASMWKKQIFTEAEMVAQGEVEGGGDTTKTILPMDSPEPAVLEAAVEEMADKVAEKVDEEQGGSGDGGDGGDGGGGGDRGYDVGQGESSKSNPQPASYADAVKAQQPAEATEDSAQHNEGLKGNSTLKSDLPEDAEEEDDESAPLLDKGKTPERSEPASVVSVQEPAGPPDLPGEPIAPEHAAQEAAVPEHHSPSKPRPVSFPAMPRLSSSMSISGQSVGSSSTPPSRSASNSDLLDGENGIANASGNSQGATPDDKKDKRRKRLSSLKGFVRRISDQGGLSRSQSMGGRSGSKNGLASPDLEAASGENEDDKKKKRLSLNRGNSSQK